MATITPSRLSKFMSVILTALAERTRKMTEILKDKEAFSGFSFALVNPTCVDIHKLATHLNAFIFKLCHLNVEKGLKIATKWNFISYLP